MGNRATCGRTGVGDAGGTGEIRRHRDTRVDGEGDSR